MTCAALYSADRLSFNVIWSSKPERQRTVTRVKGLGLSSKPGRHSHMKSFTFAASRLADLFVFISVLRNLWPLITYQKSFKYNLLNVDAAFDVFLAIYEVVLYCTSHLCYVYFRICSRLSEFCMLTKTHAAYSSASCRTVCTVHRTVWDAPVCDPSGKASVVESWDWSWQRYGLSQRLVCCPQKNRWCALFAHVEQMPNG